MPEIGPKLIAVRTDRLRFERPAGASGLCVKRVDLAIAAPHKQQTADNGRLGNGGRPARKSERPFQLQPGHLVWRQSGHRRRLKPAVVKICAPAIPSRSIEPLGKSDRILRALRNIGRGSLRDRGNCLLRVRRERQSCDASNYCNEVSPTHWPVPPAVYHYSVELLRKTSKRSKVWIGSNSEMLAASRSLPLCC